MQHLSFPTVLSPATCKIKGQGFVSAAPPPRNASGSGDWSLRNLHCESIKAYSELLGIASLLASFRGEASNHTDERWKVLLFLPRPWRHGYPLCCGSALPSVIKYTANCSKSEVFNQELEIMICLKKSRLDGHGPWRALPQRNGYSC